MFYGKVIKSGETVIPEIKDGYSVIHLSRACLNNPKDDGKLYVQVEDSKGCYNICCLQKNVCEDTSLDIFLMLDTDVKIKTSGSKNDVHIVGYYEVSFGQDNIDEDEDEFEEDEYENEEVRMLTKKNTMKNALSNGISKKKKDVEDNEDDETNVGKNDDEDEDEDEDDDDDDDEDEDEDEKDKDDDDEDEDDEEGDEKDDDEDDEDEEDEDDDEAEDAEEKEEEEDDDDDDDDDDDEEENVPKGKNDKKKGEQKKNSKENNVGNKNKRSLDNKNDTPSKKSKLDDESLYEKELVAFLKKNGKSKLTELGKVKRPESVKGKLGFFIKKRSNIFKFDKDGQTVSLK